MSLMNFNFHVNAERSNNSQLFPFPDQVNGYMQRPSIRYRPNYSRKVFFRNVHWTATEDMLYENLSPFGLVEVKWLGQTYKKDEDSDLLPRYLFVIFRSGEHVEIFLESCAMLYHRYFFALSSWRNHDMLAEIVPYSKNKSKYTLSSPMPAWNSTLSVFVNGLDSRITSERLARFLDRKFGSVLHCQLFLDEYAYPKGTARVYFSSYEPVQKAIRQETLVFRTTKFSRLIRLTSFIPRFR